MPDSPKKMCTKRKVADIDLKAAKPKRMRAQHSVVPPPSVMASTVDECQETQCSGCLGAGKGGRNVQLERLDTILDAPAWTSQPKGSNSLDSNIPANPAAPKPPHKGCSSCSKKKAAPSPIQCFGATNSEHYDDQRSNSQCHNSQSTAKDKDCCSSPEHGVGEQRAHFFLQCKDGGQFGFSQPIVPPGTEPDLQTLNNSFIAAAKETHVASNASQHHFPIITSNPSGSCLASGGDLSQPVFLRTNSTMAADTLFYQNLDPTLRPTRSQSTASEHSNSGECDGSESSDNNDKDEQIGWGAVEGRHSTHPGFSGEEQPFQPRVVSLLPPDFEFQYSCDEDGRMVEKALSVGTGLSDSSASVDDGIAPKPDNILNLHHQKNGRPQMPNPELLDLLRCAETNTSNAKVNTQAVKVAAKSKASEGPNATQLGWYGPHWKSFLEDAKVECCVQQALDNPFLKLEDLLYTVTKSLSASLVQWLKNSGQVEPDVWPAHKSDMSRLLYDDLATWCSDIKKIAIAITPSVYSLVPPATIPVQEHTAWVQNAAIDWLDDSLFLHDGVDELGKTRNFAHPGLHEATILFLYTRSYHIAFNCVLNGLIKNGNGKSFLNFMAKEFKPIYLTMLQLLCEVMEDPYHGPRLVLQLYAWAKAGWAKSLLPPLRPA
ncbi:hypothetical protein DEU56DRAFT_908935 [Suillus clintonianus]|uniref:uncharacterized protein n=1 Tax=Suillus clintonianus TaxID=1904413 RepID=UPI001B87E29E|nr:uncharacterized protein DEU56DRAFT_908935 [Suillus clintonianus]KAG2149236.1 hypothetical protein DEU56DRAFT_908935 [Suillus clintonianus]